MLPTAHLVDTSPQSYADHSLEIAHEAAEASNCDVIESTDTTLQLDLDSEGAVDTTIANWGLLLGSLSAHNSGITAIEAWRSRHGRVHVQIRLAMSLPVGIRIALQAALGSDPKREILSITRLAYGMECPSLLFRPRGAHVETTAYTTPADADTLLRSVGFGAAN